MQFSSELWFLLYALFGTYSLINSHGIGEKYPIFNGLYLIASFYALKILIKICKSCALSYVHDFVVLPGSSVLVLSIEELYLTAGVSFVECFGLSLPRFGRETKTKK